MYPAAIAAMLIRMFAIAACPPKKVPRQSDGMIFAIILCQALAVKPDPNPCQTSNAKVSTRASVFPNFDRNTATSANPRNGRRSWMVISITIGL